VIVRTAILACAVAVAAALAGAAPAVACSYTHAPEPVGDSSAIFLGGRMFDAASFVDLAVAERGEQLRGPGGRVVPAMAITFRVLRRLKGDSPDRFLLFGRSLAALDPDAKPSDLRHWVDPEGRVYPFANTRELPAMGRETMTSCDPPDVEARPGRTYLIFREADGRLLGSLPFHPDQRPVAGYAFADVGLPPDSAWARHVPHPEYRRRQRPTAETAPDEAHGLLTFRTPVPAATAKALARRAGAVPFAVTVARSGSRAEYRLGTELAWLGIIDDAVAWGARNRTDRAGLRALAGRTVDAYSAYDLGTDAAKRDYALGLLALDQLEPDAAPLVAGLAFRGDAAVRRALAAAPEVASVRTAARIRDRIGEPPSGPTQRPAASAEGPAPEILHQRLAALAGRAVAEEALAGAWRLVDVDGIPVPADTLRLGGGQVSGTLACSPFAGRYEITGLTIRFDAPKPARAACPKRDTDWLGEGFWAEPVATVRKTGAELLLARGNARYRFVREGS